MKKFILILSIVLCGCATQGPTLNVPGIERSDQVRVQDLRPAAEKQAEMFSMMITSDAYATYRTEWGQVLQSNIAALRGGVAFIRKHI